MDLPKADSDFLDKLQLEFDGAWDMEGWLDELEAKAKAGDKEAADSLELARLGLSLKEKFDAESMEMGDLALIILNQVGPALGMLIVGAGLEYEFAEFLEAIQRVAFSYGWRARDRQND